MIEATREHQGLRVVHPNWGGVVLYGTIVAVPNRWHVDIMTTQLGRVRAFQGSLVWQQDWKK